MLLGVLESTTPKSERGPILEPPHPLPQVWPETLIFLSWGWVLNHKVIWIKLPATIHKGGGWGGEFKKKNELQENGTQIKYQTSTKSSFSHKHRLGQTTVPRIRLTFWNTIPTDCIFSIQHQGSPGANSKAISTSGNFDITLLTCLSFIVASWLTHSTLNEGLNDEHVMPGSNKF